MTVECWNIERFFLIQRLNVRPNFEEGEKKLLCCIHGAGLSLDGYINMKNPCPPFLPLGSRLTNPIPLRGHLIDSFLLATRAMQNYRCKINLFRQLLGRPGFESLALRTLLVYTHPHGACTRMCPSKYCNFALVKLDDIRMGPKGLLVQKEIFDLSSIKYIVCKGPGHNEMVGCCRLKVVLRKRENVIKYFSGRETSNNIIPIKK